MKLSKSKQTVLWTIAILCVWEVVTRTGLVNNFILPPCSKVIRQAFVELLQGKLLFQIVNSMYVVLIGFVVSFTIAAVVTLGCSYSKIFESFFAALCTLFNPLPGMAVLPLIIMWFGVGNGAMLMLIIHGVLWPLVTNLLTGMRSVPRIYTEWGKNISMTPFQIFKDIYVLSVMPYVISGLRVGWGRAWRALISAEMVFGMIGSLGGVGYYIYTNRAYANTTNVMVGVLMIIVIGVTVESFLFRTIEKHTVDKWGSRYG